MEFVETKYEVTLRDKKGNEYRHVTAQNFDGQFIHDKELWGCLYIGGRECFVKFFDKNKDEELYKLGCKKVIKMERVDVYEERKRLR